MRSCYSESVIGNLIQDSKEGITKINWTVYGKIESIEKSDGTTINYSYDATGNRINKTVTKAGATNTTVYVRDAQGNVLSIYTTDAAINSGHFTQSELHLYGSSRLGIYDVNKDLTVTSAAPVNMGSGNSGILNNFERNKKLFELTNHLGNVLATVSDEKIGVDVAPQDGIIDYYTADVVSTQDYFPFGMTMPGRKFSSERYRYGFNGKENDKDITEGAQDYGMRISDNRLGRFLSVDPLTASYPWYTPYQFAGNKPIWATDLDGLEEMPTNRGNEEHQTQTTNATVPSTKGPFLETVSKTWFWHKGSQEYGTKADWYGEEEYKRLVWPISADLAGYADMYKTPGIGKNWSDDEKANVANTRLGQFISSGLSEKEVKGLLSQAYNVSMTQAANSSGRAEFAPVNVEDLLLVGQVIKLGTKALFNNAAKEAMTAYETALAGGKHSGWLNTMSRLTTSKLQKSITSMEANILEHQNLISNPAKYMQQYEKGNWNLLDPRQQQHLLNVKWPGDIQRAQEQINILQGIIKSR